MSPSPPPEPAAKRQKTSNEPELPFHQGLLVPENVDRLAAAHASSAPYKHAVIDQLFDQEFLRQARREITEQLSFTEKETDIYKINQTGDLTNLSGLPESELALLPNLLKLRDALYSETFRKFLQRVTGCGPLSGSKTDMSCAQYSQGCYLLNHDDVIGTRRISFILYLPLDEPAWQPEFGGALELYPVLAADDKNPDRPNVPTSKPTVSIPPSFNQFVFFEVQPGHSFHSVEEVAIVGDGQKGGVGARVSLSGWFHKPIEGEEGFEGSEGFVPKSSLQQLYATTLSAPTPYPESLSLPLPTAPSASDLAYLSKYLNSAYTSPKIISHLRNQFVESSHLVLSDFLSPTIASELESLIKAKDLEVEKGRRGVEVKGQTVNLIPAHTAGESAEQGWTVVGPPHLQRYLSLSRSAPAPSAADRLSQLLREIQALFESNAFAALLACLTSLLPVAHTINVRSFRPGLDYTLARGEPAATTGDNDDGNTNGEDDGPQAKLDVGLNLTPKQDKEEDQEIWEAGEAGGWDIWLVGDEGGDEATYGGSKAKPEAAEANGEQVEGQGEEEEEEEEEEDDSTLLSLEPTFNRLHLVLRDPGVLGFVKYVSAKAPGSRFDVNGEWEVRGIEEEGDDEEA
ncbi:oxidative DNA demethylase [Sporobolomyces koalae]|uniref:oxidative DNA demethylase n=1 Tax=Sporobolomyces koalae TaxID=500713 RepID=UPI003170C74E